MNTFYNIIYICTIYCTIEHDLFNLLHELNSSSSVSNMLMYVICDSIKITFLQSNNSNLSNKNKRRVY